MCWPYPDSPLWTPGLRSLLDRSIVLVRADLEGHCWLPPGPELPRKRSPAWRHLDMYALSVVGRGRWALPAHVLFDFFGTLVGYTAAIAVACAATDCAALTRSYGGGLDEAAFISAWDSAYDSFYSVAVIDHREFSMGQVSRTFLADVLRREPTPAESRALVTTYIRQWNNGVRYRPDTPAILAKLAERFTLAVVSNTHEAELVPAHIAAMGIADHFDTVLTSVEFGWRKPHPSIYAEALDRLGIDASRAVFVGDTYDADFAGPEAAGIPAYLIDPAHACVIPADRRLGSLTDLPARLLP